MSLAAVLGALAATSAHTQSRPDPAADFHVEIIAFAHSRFDTADESFDATAPDLSGIDLPQTPPRQAYFDEMTRLSLLRQIGIGPQDGAEPPMRPFPDDFLSLETFSSAPTAAAFGFRILEDDELQLTRQFRALGQSGEYVPLLHGGWVQKISTEDEAAEFDIGLLGASHPRGAVRLFFNRFTQVTVDIRYQPMTEAAANAAPAPNAASQGFFNPFAEEPGPANRPARSAATTLADIELPARYRLERQARIQIDRPYHFDHPAFGLIILVTPAPEDPEGSSRGDAGTSPSV